MSTSRIHSYSASNSPITSRRAEKFIQKQLVMYLHENETRSAENIATSCDSKLVDCAKLAGVLSHLSICEPGSICNNEYCVSSRRILIHWKNCKKDECLICKPIHEFHKKEDDDKKIVQAESKNPCVICLEDNPINPITCRNCKQLVGCSKCVLKWIRSTNMSELNRPSVLALASSNENHRCCPICRKRWRGTKDLIRTRTFPS